MDDRNKIIKKKWTDSPVYVAFDVAQYIRAFLPPAHLLIAFERVGVEVSRDSIFGARFQ